MAEDRPLVARAVVVVLTVLVVACCASPALAAHDTEALFEAAMRAYATAGHPHPH